MRTVECLRGRLLAERQVSKTANQDALLMQNKLLELENKLKEETKLRNKAEKRLKLLNKKLESLKILPSLQESEQSSSSKSSAVSSSSTSKVYPQEFASMSQNTAPEISQNVEENATPPQETTTKSGRKDSLYEDSSTNSSSSHEVTQIDYFSSSSLKASTNDSSYENSSTKSSSSHEVLPKIDYTSSSSLKASTMEINKMNGESDEDDFVVDNSLALVPMEFTENKVAPEVKIVSKSISEVLDNLRHARERIQSSMGRRRQMIRVGPS